MYAKIEEGSIAKTGPRPRWYSGHPDRGGDPLTDAELADFGWVPVVGDRPDYDPETHRVEMNPQEQWTVEATQVTRTFTVVPLTEAEILARQAARDLADLSARLSPAKLAPALSVIADTVLAEKIRTDTLSPAEAEVVKPLFRRYRVGVAYKAQDVFEYQDALYEVISPHTSQADWPPDTTGSLYTVHYAPGVIPDWTPPQGGHDAPNTGDERRHNGTCWRSLIDGNSTEPGSDPRWWEEFTCP